MTDDGWAPVVSAFPRRHTVYFQRRLSDGRRLTVARAYTADGHPLIGRWRWAVYAAGSGRPKVLAGGSCRTPRQGRVEAERAADEGRVDYKEVR